MPAVILLSNFDNFKPGEKMEVTESEATWLSMMGVAAADPDSLQPKEEVPTVDSAPKRKSSSSSTASSAS